MTGAIVGGLGTGGLVAGLRVGRSVGVLLPWGVIAGVVPRPLGTQRPLAKQALTAKIFTSSFLFPCM